MHAALASGPRGPLFYWNVDGAVGKNGVNNMDDVLFVQWCMYKLTKHAQNMPPDELDKLKKVIVNGECNGRDGDPLVEGIKAMQKAHGTMVDGRVSSVSNASGRYGGKGSKTPFLIILLNSVLVQMHPTQWPRIDLMPDFIWRTKDKAMAPFTW